MKKLFLIGLAVLPLLFASCAGNEADLTAANQRADSLQNVIDAKDGEIDALFDVLNEIETNLTEISSRYSQVNALKHSSPEMNKRVKGQITDQLAVIDNMLSQNKEKIAQLNAKIASLGEENTKLQTFIETLNNRMAEQENEINNLMNELTISKATIKQLSQNVNDLTAANKEKDEYIAYQSDQVAYHADDSHKAYYIVKTYKELNELGIVNKEGGLIFKQQHATSNVDITKFTLIDLNQVTTINVNLRKARVISNHPKDSYELVMDEQDDKLCRYLLIKDVEKFWKYTKFLIVSTKK